MTETLDAPADAAPKKAWKDMNKVERAAHMRAGKEAKKSAPPAAAVQAVDDIAALRAELEKLKAQIAAKPPTEKGTVEECWCDYTPGKLKDVIALGRPARIWSSDDPQWDTIFENDKLKRRPMSFSIGKVRRTGDDFLPGSAANPNPLLAEHSQLLPEEARDRMRKYEKEGRTFDTPKADEMRRAEEALKAGNKELAESFLAGIRELAQQMRPGVPA